MGYWLGIDHGTKRIGVAAGSSADGIASPITAISASTPQADIEAIERLAREYHAGGIVVGWPLNMDDTEGPQGKLVREFASQLASATGLDVRLWDERLSSFSADKAMPSALTNKKKKQKRDAIAAAIILQDFFASGGPDAAPKPGEI